MKCKFKSILALAIALMMCVTMLPTAAFAATPDETISTYEQFKTFRDKVNSGEDNYSGKTVLIVGEIDLGGGEFTPIGTRQNPFRGTVTGGEGKATIKNATITIESGNPIINVGIFGFVGSSGLVENLIFSNIKVSSKASKNPSSLTDEEESTTGVAVGSLDGGTIQNVIVEQSCTVDGVFRTGGISGDISKTGKILNCENHADVTGSDLYTGGITGAGHNAPLSTRTYGATVSNCKNYGKVSGTSSVGGIIGYADRAKVSGCYNYNEVLGTGNYGTGGIVGTNIYNPRSIFRPAVATEITNCHNEGNVSAPRAGGILGSYASAPGDDQPRTRLNVRISNCTNSGAISGTTPTSKIGSIFGYQISYAKGDGDTDIERMGVIITGCTNSGSPSNLSGSNIAVTIN